MYLNTDEDTEAKIFGYRLTLTWDVFKSEKWKGVDFMRYD